jgi:transposase-like protein
MTEQNQPTKKPRKRRSAEKMAELVFEAERIGASAVCRREGIAPAQLSRWKQKFVQSGIAGLRETKRGPRREDPVITAMKKEAERLREALLETSIELQALKKSDR